MKAKEIIKQQKDKYECWGQSQSESDCVRAIAEIEALEAERDSYKEALETIIKDPDCDCTGEGAQRMLGIAETALSNNQQDRKEKQYVDFR